MSEEKNIVTISVRDGRIYGQALAELAAVRASIKADKIISTPAIKAGKTSQPKAVIIPFPLIITNG